MLKDWHASKQISSSVGARPDAETSLSSYELLFESAGEPVLIVHAASSRIVEINPSAIQLLRPSAQPLEAPLESVFQKASFGAISRVLASVRTRELTETVQVRSLDGAAMQLTVSLLRAHSRIYFLVRLNPRAPAARFRPDMGLAVFDAIESADFGFVLTGANFEIDYANRWFITRAGEMSADLGEKSLFQWLDLTETDLNKLRTQRLERQAVTHITTVLRTASALPRTVEIHAVCVPRGEETCWGFTIHQLRNSGIEVDLPLIGTFPATPQPYEGVRPDIPIRESADDVSRGFDRALAAIRLRTRH